MKMEIKAFSLCCRYRGTRWMDKEIKEGCKLRRGLMKHSLISNFLFFQLQFCSKKHNYHFSIQIKVSGVRREWGFWKRTFFIFSHGKGLHDLLVGFSGVTGGLWSTVLIMETSLFIFTVQFLYIFTHFVDMDYRKRNNIKKNVKYSPPKLQH